MSSHVTVDRWQFTLAAYHGAAHFWAKIFAVNFAVGVVTGIPLEFQVGTNWASFSNFSGGVIGQTLAMEGIFAFFAEPAFIGIYLWIRRGGPRLHWISAVMIWLGSWASGFFIIASNAWMQHPVAYTIQNGRAQLASFSGLLTNPWVGWQYAHNMSGAAITGRSCSPPAERSMRCWGAICSSRASASRRVWSGR